MANKFEKSTWIDRQSQYPGRRKLVPVDGVANTYEVERAEGEITVQGKAYNNASMADLENRIYNALGTLDDSDLIVLDANNHFTATNLDGVLDELFTSAYNGKEAIATAIGAGASSSMEFDELANIISKKMKKCYISQIPVSGGGSYPNDMKTSWSQVVSVNFGFTPTQIYVVALQTGVTINNLNHPNSECAYYGKPEDSRKKTSISNVSSNGFTIKRSVASYETNFFITGPAYYIAIG